jgi:hypothetical protein
MNSARPISPPRREPTRTPDCGTIAAPGLEDVSAYRHALTFDPLPKQAVFIHDPVPS